MIYFDNAATTFPKPEVVNEKTIDAMRNFGANPGRSGHKLSLKMDREIFNTRSLITEFVGGDNPLNLIFTKNCTESLNIAIKGLANQGDHIITTSLEHNSVLRPLKELENSGVIELTIVNANRNGVVDPKDIEEAIKDNTKICVTTAMSNLIGTIVDIDEIGKILKKNNIKYIVDAAQSLGYLDIDVKKSNIDILCFPGHKSLFGPMGTGGLYINTEEKLKPIMQGGTGSFSMELEQPGIYPDMLESGTVNGVGIVGLGAGVEFINEIGLERIKKHEDELKDLFITGLKDITNIKIYGTKDYTQGPVVSINIDGLDSSELAYILSENHEIYVRAGFHCAPLAHKTIGTDKTGAVRFSFSYFNNEKEVKNTLAVLENIAKENN